MSSLSASEDRDTETLKAMVRTRIKDMKMTDPVEIVRDITAEKKLNEREQDRALSLAQGMSSSFELRKAVSEKTDMVEVARYFVEQHPVHYDRAKVWWVWNRGGWWEMKDEVDVINSLYEGLGDAGITSSSVKSQYVTATQMVARQTEPLPPSDRWIQFRDVVYDLDADSTFEPRPTYFFTNPIPWEYEGAGEDCPTIDSLFEEWVGAERKRMLYELCAYCMLPAYPINRIFCLLGSGRNGKSRFQKVLRKLVGYHNVAATDLDRLKDSRFEAASLYRKLVAEIGETKFSTLDDTKLIKRCIGEDPITVEFKHKSPITTLNYAKIIVSTNTLPATTDRTAGFMSKWVIIDFPNVFDRGEDVVDKIPDREFAALARRCAGVLKELLDAGSFTGEGTMQERMARYESKSDPVKKFAEENLEREPSSQVWLWEFYDALEYHLKVNNHRDMSQKEVSVALNHLGYEIVRKHTKTEDGKDATWRCIIGHRWKKKGGSVPGVPDEQTTPFDSHGMERKREPRHNRHTRHGEEPAKCDWCNSAATQTILDGYAKGGYAHLCDIHYRERIKEVA